VASNQQTAEATDPDEAISTREPGNAQLALTPQARSKLAEIRSRIETSVGQIVLMLMQAPRYRHHSLADLNHLIIEPLLRDRIAIAFAKTDEADTSANRPPEGVAIWASVDDATEAKIHEQINAGVFPVRLASDEWVSGEALWLLDVIASNQKAATAVLLNFNSIAGERKVHLHPVVARSVDPAILERLKLK
jgi:hemolysin-activating ACP:hemolysin acyltransferase